MQQKEHIIKQKRTGMSSNKSIFLILICLCIWENSFAQWKAMDCPPFAESRDLLQTDNGRIFLATGAGLFHSDDLGENWTQPFSGNISKGSVSWIQAAKNVLIARIFDPIENVGVFLITEDYGDTWQNLNLPSSTASSTRIYLNEKVIIARLGSVTSYSYDLGETWEFQNFGEVQSSFFQVYPVNDHFYLQDLNGGLWVSDSNAENWDSLSLVLNQTSTTIIEDGSTIIAAANQDSIYYSQDAGQTWSSYNQFGTSNDFFDGLWTKNDTLFLLYKGSIYTSAPLGADWKKINDDFNDYDDLVFLGGESILMAEDAGFFFSPDYGISRESRQNGIRSSSIFDFSIDQNKLYSYIFADRGLYSNSIIDGAIVQDARIPITTLFDEMVAIDGYVFVNDEVLSSNDQNIKRINPDGTIDLIQTNDNGVWLEFDLLRYEDNKLLYFNGSERIYSENYGDSWNPMTELHEKYFTDLVRYEDAIFVITEDGPERKKDSETTWSIINEGLALDQSSSVNIFDSRLYSTDSALFLALSRNGDHFEFYVSHDDGDNWIRIAEQFDEVIVPFLNSPYGVQNIVKFGDYHAMGLRNYGVVISDDNGLYWVRYNDGMSTDRVRQIQVYDGKLIAGTDAQGFWILDPDDIRLQNVEGTVFYDADKDANFDFTELALSQIKVANNTEDYVTFTDSEGKYNLTYVTEGNYGPRFNNQYLSSVPGMHNTMDGSNLDFAIQLQESVSDLCVSIHTNQVHRPGFNTVYQLKYINLAGPVNNASLTFNFDESFSFVSSSTTDYTILGNEIIFPLGTLDPLQEGQITLNFRVSESTVLGSQVSSILIATMDETDNNIENNEAMLREVVVGSYDPNDIAVSDELIYPQDVINTKTLKYKIRFQNTGTYLAERVIVTNAVPDGLSLASIKNITTSHAHSIENDGARGLSFVFDEIFLPDSTSNETESHGFIEYEIDVVDELNIGDFIFNDASIFFDYNLPIHTNEASTEVRELSSIVQVGAEKRVLEIFPNPSADKMQLKLQDKKGKLVIIDNNGKLCFSENQFSSNDDSVDIRHLKIGMYYVLFRSENEEIVYRGKLLKQ